MQKQKETFYNILWNMNIHFYVFLHFMYHESRNRDFGNIEINLLLFCIGFCHDDGIRYTRNVQYIKIMCTSKYVQYSITLDRNVWLR